MGIEISKLTLAQRLGVLVSIRGDDTAMQPRQAAMDSFEGCVWKGHLNCTATWGCRC